MGKALYSRNECCNNQLKTIFFPDNSFFQVHSNFPRILNKIIKFQYFSRTGKTCHFFFRFSRSCGNPGYALEKRLPCYDSKQWLIPVGEEATSGATTFRKICMSKRKNRDLCYGAPGAPHGSANG